MHRCGSALLVTLIVLLVFALTGCLGNSSPSSSSGGVQSISLNPSGTTSIDVGTTQTFIATAKDANGHTVLGINIEFVVGVPAGYTEAPAVSVNTAGNVCAGTWDSTGAICSPGLPGLATVTAITNGISSPVTTVYVHQHIDTVQILEMPPNGQELYDCFSQGQSWIFEGIAYSAGIDITNTVGPISWASSNVNVLTTTAYVPPQEPSVLNQVQVTAKNPGITNLIATVSGVSSNPFPYTTCLIQSIRLQIASQGQESNEITVNNGTSIAINATAVDTLYGIANNTPLASPPLTWSTTNPEVVGFTTLTNSTGTNTASARNNLGGATVFASCAPPTCNIGVQPSLPIYSSNGTLPNGLKAFGTLLIDVTSTSNPPTYSAYAATNQCQDQSGCTSALFEVTPGTTPIGTIVTLPRTPNSIKFNYVASGKLYIGSDQGLMYLTPGGTNTTPTLVSSAQTPCNVSLCGKIIAISNDGKQVVVSDSISVPSQVYIYNSTSGVAPIDLIIPGEIATAAAFSPDQLKIFILTNAGNMYVYSTVDALTSVPIATSVTNLAYSIDGSFAYVGGTPAPNSISAYANCDIPAANVLSGVTTSYTPLAIYPSPLTQFDSVGNPTQVVLALDPPNIDSFGVNVTQHPLPDGQFVCTPPTVSPDPNYPVVSANLGEGNFVPVYSNLVNDGNQLIVVAQNIPAVLLFNVNDGTTNAIRLVGNANPLAADASTDGSQVYVAACDQYQGSTCTAGSVHIVCTSVCTTGQGDFQQVPYENKSQQENNNMCNGQGIGAPLCVPNLIAIKPQ